MFSYEAHHNSPLNVTVKCETLYSLCQVCQRYIRISHRLFFNRYSSQSCVQRPFATEPTPIKQHTRAEKRKFKELEGNLLCVSVSFLSVLLTGSFLRYGLDASPWRFFFSDFFSLTLCSSTQTIQRVLGRQRLLVCVFGDCCLFTAKQTVKCTG